MLLSNQIIIWLIYLLKKGMSRDLPVIAGKSMAFWKSIVELEMTNECHLAYEFGQIYRPVTLSTKIALGCLCHLC